MAGACRGGSRPEAPRVGRGSVNVATIPARWAALAPWAAPVGASQPARGARGLRPPLLRKYAPIVLFLRFFVRILVELIIFASSVIFVGLKVFKNGTLYFYFGASYFAFSPYQLLTNFLMGQINVKVQIKKNPQTGDFGWILTPILYSLIDREAILDAATRNSQIPRSYLQQTFDALEVELRNFVMNGHSISLSHFGTISSSIRSRGRLDADNFQPDRDIKQVKFNFRAAPRIKRNAQKCTLVITEPYVPTPPEP